MGRHTRRGATVVAVALVTLAAACGSPSARPKASPAPLPPVTSKIGAAAVGYTGSGPKVVILGDSLTVLEWKDLYNGLDRRYAVEIAAWLGEGYNPGKLSIALGGPVIPKSAAIYARSHPAVAVLALGTNDAWNRRSITNALAVMATIVREFHGACLVGVTLPEHSTVKAWSNTEAHALNDAMRKWADRVVDWATMSAAPGVLSMKDGIHTTPKGTKLRADAIVSAVEDCKTAHG